MTRFEQTGPPGTARQRCLVAECDYACGSIVVIVVIFGLWVVKEADRLREERSNDVMQLIEINRMIRDAL